MFELIINNPIKFVAAFISMLALLTALYHGYATRRHFRLSVKPHLCFEFGKSFADNTIHITLMNYGLGPAIINKFVVVSESRQILPGGPTELSNLIMQLSNLSFIDCSISIPHKNESIAANGKIKIVCIQLDPATLENYNIDELLARIIPLKFKIEYESMYGEKLYVEYPPEFHVEIGKN